MSSASTTRRRVATATIAGLALTAQFTLASPTPAATVFDVQSFPAVTDNIGAAVAMSQVAFPEGNVTRALLARDDAFADALASGWLQGALNAPLILTKTNAVDTRVRNELLRLGVEQLEVLGGEAAIATSVVDEIEAMGIDVTRHAGSTRIETAILLAERFHDASADGLDSVVLARAFDDGPGTDPIRGFVDSIGIGAFAAYSAYVSSIDPDYVDSLLPIVLSDTAGLSPQTASFLDQNEFTGGWIGGGTAALSESVRDGVRTRVTTTERIAGENRFGTAIEAILYSWGDPSESGFDGHRVIVVDGTNSNSWAPGFAAPVARGAIVLVDGDAVPAETSAYLESWPDEAVADLICAPFVSATACQAVEAALSS